MGLDITAYKGLRVVQTNVKLDENGLFHLNIDWDTMWYPGGGNEMVRIHMARKR